MWELINKVIEKSSDKTNIIMHIRIDNIDVLNKNEIANKFGKYFLSVGKKFANKVKQSKENITYYNTKIDQNTKSIYFHKVTECEVKKLINQLPNKTSSGHDEINNILLKKISKSILAPLTKIFNMSITTRIFPIKVKLAETSPLFKGKETYYTNNYRSISLLLTILKILEKLVYKRTYNFLNRTNQFYNSQYGFRNSHSCEDAVCELKGELIKNKENGMYIAAIFLDLSKVFNTLEHQVLYLRNMEYKEIASTGLKAI